MRKIKGVNNFKGTRPAAETSVSFNTFQRSSKPEFWLGLRSLSFTLREFRIEACDTLNALPEWFGELKSLTSLNLRYYCSKLVSLSEGLRAEGTPDSKIGRVLQFGLTI